MTKRKLLSILVLVSLVLAAVGPTLVPTGAVMAAPEAKESHAGASQTLITVYGANYYCFQTFTASSSYVLDSIRPNMYRTGTPGNVTVELYRVNHLDYYVGARWGVGATSATPLSTGSANTSGLGTTEGTASYLEVSMAEFYVASGDLYAFVVKAPDGDSGNKLTLISNSDGYAGGWMFNTSNDGSSWYYSTKTRDLRFQVWGEVLDTYPTVTTSTPSGLSSSAATFGGSLTALGSGATDADVSFEWDYQERWDDHDQYSTTPANKTETGTFSDTVDIPVGGRPYQVRAVATNDLGNTAYGATKAFNPPAFPVTIGGFDYSLVHRGGELTHTFQRKALYAAGRHWLFALLRPTGDMDTGFYYTTSLDGLDWEPWTWWYGLHPESTEDNEADEFSTYFDGTYIHIAYVYNRWYEDPDSNDLVYRRGLPNTDGTITWSTDTWQTVEAQDDGVKGYPSVSLDDSGHAYVAVWKTPTHSGEMESGTKQITIYRNDNTDGTWSTATGYPVQLGSGFMFQNILALEDGQMYVIASKSGSAGDVNEIYGFLYDGTSWDTTGEEINPHRNDGGTGIAGSGRGWSASSWGSSIYLVFQADDTGTSGGGAIDPGDTIFKEYSAGAWGSNVVLSTGHQQSGHPSLAVNGANRDLYVFWYDWHPDYYHHIRYITRQDGVWDSELTDWVNESFYQFISDSGVAGQDLSQRLQTYPEVYSGRIAVYYTTAYKDGTHTIPKEYPKSEIRMALLEVEAGPAVRTEDAVDIGPTSMTLQGTLVNDGGESCQVRFQYGLTTNYGTNTAWQSGKGTGDVFEATITDLAAATKYHFRTQAKWADGTTTSGDGRYATTLSASTPSVSTGSAASVTQTSATIQGSVTSMGDYDTVYVYFEWGLTTGYEQSPTTEQTKTSTGGFSASLTGLSASTVYYYRAALRYGSTTIYGAQGTFTTTAASGDPGVDPPDILRIDDVKVYTGYFEDGDQLYCINYRIIYLAGDPGWDIGDYFDFVLLDGTLTRAKVPVKSWGYRPGSIYLKAASALSWGGSYTVKIVGNPNVWDTPPEAEYTLTSGDWQGDDLTQLDTWVTSLALSIEAYYDVQLVDYYEGQLCLTEQGAVVFGMGIQGLCVVRPRLCNPYSYVPGEEGTDGTIPPTDTNALVGPQVSDAVSDVATFLNLEDTSIAGAIGFGIGFFILGIVLTVMLGSWGTMSGAAGMGMASPVVIFGAWLGYVPWPLIIIIAAIAGVYSILVMWVKGV